MAIDANGNKALISILMLLLYLVSVVASSQVFIFDVSLLLPMADAGVFERMTFLPPFLVLVVDWLERTVIVITLDRIRAIYPHSH